MARVRLGPEESANLPDMSGTVHKAEDIMSKPVVFKKIRDVEIPDRTTGRLRDAEIMLLEVDGKLEEYWVPGKTGLALKYFQSRFPGDEWECVFDKIDLGGRWVWTVADSEEENEVEGGFEGDTIPF